MTTLGTDFTSCQVKADNKFSVKTLRTLTIKCPIEKTLEKEVNRKFGVNIYYQPIKLVTTQTTHGVVQSINCIITIDKTRPIKSPDKLS